MCLVAEQRLWWLCSPIFKWQSLLQLTQMKTESSCGVDAFLFCLFVACCWRRFASAVSTAFYTPFTTTLRLIVWVFIDKKGPSTERRIQPKDPLKGKGTKKITSGVSYGEHFTDCLHLISRPMHYEDLVYGLSQALFFLKAFTRRS